MKMPVPESRNNENEEMVESDEEKVFLKPVVEDRNMALARKCTEMISDVRYKEEYEKSKGKYLFVLDTPQLTHVKNLSAFISEAKYKGTAKKELSNSLYKQMPATIDSVFAKEVSKLQSKRDQTDYTDKVRLRLIAAAIAGVRAQEQGRLPGRVVYKQKHDAEKGTSNYAHMKEPPDVKHAMEVNKHQSNVSIFLY
uniref:Uncharacterized protein n=1 Tax=Sphaerodactylus townsendi TaxID=933632 RepID=A0ACB8FW75_9SAUR